MAKVKKTPEQKIETTTKDRCFVVYDKGQELVGHIKELTWLFKLLLEKGEGVHTDGITTAVRIKKLLTRPSFFFGNKNDIQMNIYSLLMPVLADKGFLRKHHMEHYHPNYEYTENSFTEDGSVFFIDFADDFLRAYLKDKDRLGVKNLSNDNQIESIDILEDPTERKAITLYINENYENPFVFARRKYFSALYELARDEEIKYNKGVFDYFNSNAENPLYKKYKFSRSAILKKDLDYIKTGIPVILRTQKFLSQRNKKLKPA